MEPPPIPLTSLDRDSLIYVALGLRCFSEREIEVMLNMEPSELASAVSRSETLGGAAAISKEHMDLLVEEGTRIHALQQQQQSEEGEEEEESSEEGSSEEEGEGERLGKQAAQVPISSPPVNSALTLHLEALRAERMQAKAKEVSALRDVIGNGEAETAANKGSKGKRNGAGNGVEGKGERKGSREERYMEEEEQESRLERVLGRMVQQGKFNIGHHSSPHVHLSTHSSPSVPPPPPSMPVNVPVHALPLFSPHHVVPSHGEGVGASPLLPSSSSTFSSVADAASSLSEAQREAQVNSR